MGDMWKRKYPYSINDNFMNGKSAIILEFPLLLMEKTTKIGNFLFQFGLLLMFAISNLLLKASWCRQLLGMSYCAMIGRIVYCGFGACQSSAIYSGVHFASATGLCWNLGRGCGNMHASNLLQSAFMARWDEAYFASGGGARHALHPASSAGT